MSYICNGRKHLLCHNIFYLDNIDLLFISFLASTILTLIINAHCEQEATWLVRVVLYNYTIKSIGMADPQVRQVSRDIYLDFHTLYFLLTR